MSYTSLHRNWRGSGRSFFHITGHLTLEFPVDSDTDLSTIEKRVDSALAKAWLALRYHHPTIASQTKLDPTTGKYMKVYPQNSVGWLERTFVVLSTGHSGAEWANHDPPAPALPTLYALAFPSAEDRRVIRRDLVFRSPHDIIDGIGTLLLFDNYVRHTAEAFTQGGSYQPPSLDDPKVFQNLSPPFRVAAAIPPEPSEAALHRLASLDIADAADKARNAEVAALPYKKGALAPGIHRRVEITLSPEQTARLTGACKEVGSTVTQVFHAAIALVLRNLQPMHEKPRSVEYVGYLLRNERGSCVPPFNGHEHAAAVYHSTSSEKLIINMAVPSRNDDLIEGPRLQVEKQEFLEIVQQMREFYLKVRDDPEHHRLAPLLWARRSIPLPLDEHAIPPIPPPSDSPSASISSMGRIDNIIRQKHGDIEVYNPWVTGEELRNGLGLFLGTFRGSLSFSAAYNDAWHDKDEVLQFVESCTHLVNAGLGLEESR
ncbi:unnamed protein product [Clonostachys solani]|uniref:Uncharacterized protein n=1 Tax=Clonostachys solani TaxID=160281 RepID=A0A9N9ZL04_9HYPO|nr:unnamed protein product [Clonostachys solani]